MDISKLIPKDKVKKLQTHGSPFRMIGLILITVPCLLGLGIYLGAILTGSFEQFTTDMQANGQTLLSILLLAVIFVIGIALFFTAEKSEYEKMVNGELTLPISYSDTENIYLEDNGRYHIIIPRTRINDFETAEGLKSPQIVICGKLHDPIITLRVPPPSEN